MRYKFLPSFVKRRGRITSSQEDNLKLLPNLAINSYDDICSAKKDFSKLILELNQKNLSEKAIFRHALMGRINLSLTLFFFELHFNHHLKQINKRINSFT